VSNATLYPVTSIHIRPFLTQILSPTNTTFRFR
jgi:hypothetical protein